MTTWKLKLTPPGGPITEKTGLSREQTLEALADLMYGTFDDDVATAAPSARTGERELAPLAA
jgi:hypothetical protein